MADDELTPDEQRRYAELVQHMDHETALEHLALARGEWPGQYVNGKPRPWPDDEPGPPPAPVPEP